MTAEVPGLPGRWLYPMPYILTGIFPFWAGMLLAQVAGFPLRPGIWVTGTLGVLALILAVFASGEAFGPGVGQCPALGGLPPRRPGGWPWLAWPWRHCWA